MSTETIEVDGVRIEVTTTTTVTAVPIEPPVVVPPPVEPPPVEPPVTGKVDAGAPWPVGSVDVTPMQAPGGLRPVPWTTTMRTIYLDAKKGNDGNDGLGWPTAKKTWQGVQAAIVSGDAFGRTVIVRDGTDPGPVVWTKSGIADTDDGLIVIRPETPGGVTLTGDKGGAFSIFSFRGCSNVWFHGFKVDGAKARGGHCIDGEDSHSIHVTHNEVFNGPFGGISFAWDDLINIAHNVCYNNSLQNWGSNISVYQPKIIGPGLPGYRVMVHNNICYGARYGGGQRTDNNGIIFDDWRCEQKHSRTPERPYLGAGLMAYNLAVDNDGYGLKVLWCDDAPIDVYRNTSWVNARDDRKGQTWDADSGRRSSRATRWRGNISVANSNSGDPHAVALSDNRTDSEPPNDLGGIDYNFAIDLGRAEQHTRAAGSPRIDPDVNWIGVSPRFIRPTNDPKTWDFSLAADSPARGVVPPLPSRWA